MDAVVSAVHARGRSHTYIRIESHRSALSSVGCGCGSRGSKAGSENTVDARDLFFLFKAPFCFVVVVVVVRVFVIVVVVVVLFFAVASLL